MNATDRDRDIAMRRAKRIFLFLAYKIAGLRGLQIAAVLASNESLSAEEISELTGIPIAIVRDTLERFQNNGILYTTRAYSYDMHSMTFKYYYDELTILRSFKDKLKNTIIHLSKITKYRGKFYYCQTCNRYYSEDIAMENNFTCPVCGSSLEERNDINEKIGMLKDYVEQLRKKFIQSMYI